MLDSITLKRNIIAQEAFTVNSLSHLVQRVVPNLIHDFKDMITGLAAPDSRTQLSGESKTLLKILPKHSYMDVSPLTVFVPEGLDVSLDAYQEVLLESMGQCKLLIPELNEYTGFLSRLITNKDDQLSTHYVQQKFLTLNDNLDVVQGKVMRCFKKNSTTTEKKLKDVVPNNSIWENLLENAELLNIGMLEIQNTVIMKKMSECGELLDVIQKKIKNNDLNHLGSEMVMKISEYTYVVARFLEFYSVTCYRVKGYTTALNQSVEKIVKVLK